MTARHLTDRLWDELNAIDQQLQDMATRADPRERGKFKNLLSEWEQAAGHLTRRGQTPPRQWSIRPTI